MSSNFGTNLSLTIFGESHGPAIGAVIDGLPVGEMIDLAQLNAFSSRRAPGKYAYETARKEPDLFTIESGLYQGKTNGAPLTILIKNSDTHSSDYSFVRNIPRPSHADRSSFLRYHGFGDPRGGGHFSGRLTAPLCVVGGICLQILARQGITIGAHIKSIASIFDDAVSSLSLTASQLEAVSKKTFSVFSDIQGKKMQEEILSAKKEGDSCGGSIEAFALGLPEGLGSPMFGGVENRVSAALFAIPAVRGVSFGDGFFAAQLRGSEHNDCFTEKDNKLQTETNHHGGVLGGITTGMPLVVTVAIKPTPSIAKAQHTFDLSNGKMADLSIPGRHDPCIVPRAVPCVESALAITLLDLLLDGEYSYFE